MAALYYLGAQYRQRVQQKAANGSASLTRQNGVLCVASWSLEKSLWKQLISNSRIFILKDSQVENEYKIVALIYNVFFSNCLS